MPSYSRGGSAVRWTRATIATRTAQVGRRVGVAELTFQVIRRTIAPLGKTKGHVKNIPGMMRHSKASTTTDVYMQSLEPEVRSTINSIHAKLVGNGTTGPEGRDPLSPGAPEDKRPTEIRNVAVPARTKSSKPNPVRGGFWSLLQDCYKVAEGREGQVIRMFGGPDRDRTDDLFHAMEARSQLRHRPTLGNGTLPFSRSRRDSSNQMAL